MIGILRTTLILAVVILAFTLTVQARTTQSNPCPKPNEEYNLCGSSCPTTCGDFLGINPPKVCTHECVLGCFCQNSYVRENEEPTSRCIKTEDCLLIA